jgi:hypothetical protein
MMATRRRGESKTDFVRHGVEAELERREQAQPKSYTAQLYELRAQRQQVKMAKRRRKNSRHG